MGQVNCVKCNKSFEENRDKWPSNVCPNCDANTVCSKCQKKKVKMEPTLPHGLEWCVDCRLFSCHFCGATDSMFSERICPRCHNQHVLTCADGCSNPTLCIPSHLKVPPSTYDAIRISSEQRQIAQKATPTVTKKLPLKFGKVDTDDIVVPEVDEGEALSYALAVYRLILKTRLGRMSNLGFTNEESTYAVSLLLGPIANPGHFRIIVTFSQYNRTYTDSNLRSNQELNKAMLEADPEYEMKANGSHRIKRNGIWYPYVRDASNDHHAEARALQFASTNDMLILYIFPTKDYCTTGPKGGCNADVSSRLGETKFKANNQVIVNFFNSTKV